MVKKRKIEDQLDIDISISFECISTNIRFFQFQMQNERVNKILIFQLVIIPIIGNGKVPTTNNSRNQRD